MAVMFVFAAVSLLIGIIVLFTNRKNLKRRKRIKAMPTTPIAQAQGNAAVEVKGRILPSEQGVLQAPFSGVPAVWVRVTVQQLVQQGKSSTWRTILQETDGRHFWIDDGSGQMARVIPQGAEFNVDKKDIAGSGTFNAAPPHIEAFLQSRGQKSTNMIGMNRRMKYSEEVLQPNEAIFAIGPSRRDPGPPVSDGYRVTPSSQLVLFSAMNLPNAAGNPDFELLLSNKDEAKLLKALLMPTVVGLVLLVIGLGLGVGGAVMAFLGDGS